MKEIYINSGNSGGRLDKLLFKYLDKAPSGFVYKMLRKKNITLNGAKAEGSALLKEGDVIRLYLSDETVEKFRSGGAAKKNKKIPELRVLYEDENICAACKDAGLLSQKAKPDDVSANDFFLEHIESDEFFRPGIQNRLDRNTSGIVLSGKNPAAARELSRIIRQRTAVKKYFCPVCGVFEKEEILEAWLLKDTEKNKVCVLSQEEPGAVHIMTGCRPLRSNGKFTLLEVELITGKPHQIRAHLASTGHPVVGDAKYGDKKINEYAKQKYGVKYQLLHAASFEFKGAQGVLGYLNGTIIKADLPENFAGFLKGENLWEPGDPEA